MSEEMATDAVLSRDELDALLSSFSDAGADGEGSPLAPAPSSPEVSLLRDPLESFALAQSRHLSNVYQIRIGIELSQFEQRTAGDLATTLLDSDRLGRLLVQPAGEEGLIWMNRPLLFALLALMFGARSNGARNPCPTRAFTGIELRILKRVMSEILEQLSNCLSEPLGARCELLGLASREYVDERTDAQMALATFDVHGLGDVCRMRVGLPLGVLADLRPSKALPAGDDGMMRGVMVETPLEIRAELGAAELSLAEVASLAPGSVIPIDASDDGSVVLRVEGQPKFRGTRGCVGAKLAVQLTERIGEEWVDGGRS